MSLRRIVLRNFVIVESLELDLDSGFSVLTGETGAGKSILIDALQLALGGRGDAGVVREGQARCEIAAEFDAPPSVLPWLDEHGFTGNDGLLLLRRTVDADGRSRAWINGGAATLTQLKEIASELVDIHGQHAWQSLTRSDAVRALLDGYAGVELSATQKAWGQWRQAKKTLESATERQASLQQESERLAWQIAEVNKLAPGADEWPELNAQHSRLANAQGLIDAAQSAVAALDDEDNSAAALISRALTALQTQAHIEPAFAEHTQALEAALAQVQDTVHSLHQYQRHTDQDPASMAAMDHRLSLWVSLARRFRRAPEDVAELHTQWKLELAQIDQALDMAAP